MSLVQLTLPAVREFMVAGVHHADSNKIPSYRHTGWPNVCVSQKLRRVLWIIWLSLAAILTSATQFRSAQLAFGPGEALLLIWIGATLIKTLLIDGRPVSLLAREICVFWGMAFLLLSLGWTLGLYWEISDLSAYHDTAAYVFIFGLSFAVAHWIHPSKALSSIHYLTLFSSIILPTLIGAWLIFGDALPVEIWYEGDVRRLSAWSSNPNQLALLICPLPLFSGYLAMSCQTIGCRLGYTALFLPLLFLGYLTGSDALFVAWFSSFTLVIFLKSLQLAGASRINYLRSVTVKLIVLILLVTSLVIAFTVATELYSERILDSLNTGNQASDRLMLWQHGVDAILFSPIVGLGPGAYSGLMAPFSSTEAHNSIIDWGMNTGTLGMILLLFAYVTVLIRSRAQSLLLFGAVLSLLVFSLFHHVLRQPLFWLYIIVAMVSMPARKSEVTAN